MTIGGNEYYYTMSKDKVSSDVIHILDNVTDDVIRKLGAMVKLGDKIYIYHYGSWRMIPDRNEELYSAFNSAVKPKDKGNVPKHVAE
jgi:hypothetical protein